jgi:hypothetical protein
MQKHLQGASLAENHNRRSSEPVFNNFSSRDQTVLAPRRNSTFHFPTSREFTATQDPQGFHQIRRQMMRRASHAMDSVAISLSEVVKRPSDVYFEEPITEIAEMENGQLRPSIDLNAETDLDEFGHWYSIVWLIYSSVRSVLWVQGRGINFLYVLSCVFAIAEATVFPLLAVAVAEAAVIVLVPNHDSDKIALWCGVFAVIAAGNVIMSYLRTLTANLHGTYITQRLRTAAMRQLIHQPAAWYDLLPNASGLYLTISIYDLTCSRIRAEYFDSRLPNCAICAC